jgi:hypothetical protein
LFSEQGLGKEWDTLISSWAAFEDQEGYKEAGRPTTSGRPEIVSQWIARARSVTWRPTISNLKDYEDKYNEWWKRLQPTWRIIDGKVDVARTMGDWGCLRLPGLNGILSIIAALFFWGLATEGEGAQEEQRAAWVSAVEDCHIVLSFLASR